MVSDKCWNINEACIFENFYILIYFFFMFIWIQLDCRNNLSVFQ